jgi:hypothetical protein
VRKGFVAAYRAQGVLITEKHVGVTDRGPLTKFMLRIGRAGNLLPSLDYIEIQIKQNRVAPGSLEGAARCLIGSVQQSGSQARVTMRTVQTETGVVLEAAKADAEATAEGVAKAISRALAKLRGRKAFGGLRRP